MWAGVRGIPPHLNIINRCKCDNIARVAIATITTLATFVAQKSTLPVPLVPLFVRVVLFSALQRPFYLGGGS
jgi:hypothetical protein